MEEIDSNKLTKNLESEIYETVIDLETDYAELALDSITENGILKEIPIVKTLVAFYNVSSSLVARHNVKKILVFLKEFHSKKVDPGKLEKFRRHFEENPKHREDVLETVLVLNEKFIEVEKSKILANLFKAHIEDLITWSEFNHLSFVLNSLHPMGYNFLEKMSREPHWSNHGRDREGEAFMFACGIGHRHGSLFAVTSIGQKLFEFGIKPSRQ